MDFDEDKIDECTLALLYLVTHEPLAKAYARIWILFNNA